MNKQKGFTLIELLVVIAIIGILSSIVLASLSTARNKGQDAKVKGQLSSIRNAAESYYSANNNYGPVNTSLVCSYSGSGTDSRTGMWKDVPSGMSALTTDSNWPGTVAVLCFDNNTSTAAATSWAAIHVLSDDAPSGTRSAWCVDSSGAAVPIAAVTPGTNTATTKACK